eukprot:gene7410-9110_t
MKLHHLGPSNQYNNNNNNNNNGSSSSSNNNNNTIFDGKEKEKFYSFTCIPTSSGYSLGSCNWVIENSNEKIVYLSDSSLSISRYPEPFNLVSLQNPDILICTKLNNYPNQPPDEMLTDLCSSIGTTLNGGGNVIIPSYSCGIVLDLFEHLSDYLGKVGLLYVPIYFISSVSKSVLSYADIYSEWLNKSKQERSFMPETPFFHQDMMRKGQFHSIQHVHSNFQPNEPCIIFVGHPSCRLGDIVHLLRQYGDNPKNSLFFIEPDFEFKKTILPYSKLTCKIQFFPIDPRINFQEANILISKLSPKHLILLNNYSNFIKNKHLNGNEGIVSIINSMDIIKIKSNQKFEPGFIDKSLALQIQTKLIETGQLEQVQIAEVTGI